MKLYNGDCLEIMKLIPDKSIDAIITDPPYGTTACKWDSVIPFEPMWKQLNRIIKDNGAIVLFGSEPFSSALRMSNIKNYKYDWIWEKSKASNFVLAKKQPLKAHEVISVFNSKIYNPQKTKGDAYNKGREKRKGNLTGFLTEVTNSNNYLIENKTGLRNPRTVQYFVTAESEGKFHPTQKPIKLMEYLIKTYTNEQEIVLDFTMGSGTTGVACCNLNRDFIGIELDKDYFKIAEQRIKNEL
jgi:site-specific DNA-methyltransferase (adenine-specific)